MPARTGAEFLDRLSRTRTHVEIQGETLNGGIADHPAFTNVVRTYAALFDLQHAPECRNILTYPSPDHQQTAWPPASSSRAPARTWPSAARRTS